MADSIWSRLPLICSAFCSPVYISLLSWGIIFGLVRFVISNCKIVWRSAERILKSNTSPARVRGAGAHWRMRIRELAHKTCTSHHRGSAPGAILRSFLWRRKRRHHRIREAPVRVVMLFIGHLLWEEEQEIHSLSSMGRCWNVTSLSTMSLGMRWRWVLWLGRSVRASKPSWAGFHPWSGNLDPASPSKTTKENYSNQTKPSLCTERKRGSWVCRTQPAPVKAAGREHQWGSPQE